MIFETERLIVRQFRDDDAQKLYENHKDAEVSRWFPNESLLLRQSKLKQMSRSYRPQTQRR